MEFYPQPLRPPQPHSSSISLNDPNFPYFYETANDRNNFLGYFLTCMKNLHLYNYNLVIHQNVINMIQRLKEERYVYLSETNRLKEKINQLEYQNGVFKTQLSKENIKANNLNTMNEKLWVNVSNLKRFSAISDKKCQEMEQKLNSTNVQNQELSKQAKFFQDENIDLNFKIKEFKGKMKSIKECEEIISTKNEEIEKLNENIQNLINEKCSTIIDEVVDEHKTILGLKKKLKEYEIQLNYEKENIQKLINEKAMIIIEFSKKVDQEHRMVKDLEEKLQEYEIRKNCIISEADRSMLDRENEQTNVQKSRKRPRLSSISNNYQNIELSSNLSQDIKQFCGPSTTSFYQSDHSPQNPLSETSDTTLQPYTNTTNRHENIS